MEPSAAALAGLGPAPAAHGCGARVRGGVRAARGAGGVAHVAHNVRAAVPLVLGGVAHVPARVVPVRDHVQGSRPQWDITLMFMVVVMVAEAGACPGSRCGEFT